MTTTILKWLIVVFGLIHFGFMGYDGIRALTVGDYVRPTTGEYAGQLGPWSNVTLAVGIDPESTLMKSIFVVWGLIGLIITVCFAMGLSRSWKGLLAINVCSLWYLVIGTISSLIQIVALFIAGKRQ